MAKSFLPDTDSGLLQWSINFDALIQASAVTYGLTVGEAAAYHVVHQAYETKYTTAVTPETRTKMAVQEKNDARANLRKAAGNLAKKIQGTDTVTNGQRVQLGLTVPDVEPTPIPPPSSKAGLELVRMDGHRMDLRVFDTENPTKRRKPAGCKGYTVVSYVGENPPLDPNQWTFQGSATSGMEFSIDFDLALEPGTRVWAVAFWFNPTSQSGPASDPVGGRIQFSNVSEAA